MITASLVGAQTPPLVQIIISETPAGEEWELIGTDGVHTWTVPGGKGVGDGEQLTLSDNRSPGNRPITYVLMTIFGNESAAPITVPFPTSLAIQSLDGSKSINVEIAGSTLTATNAAQQELYRIPGRRRPAVRYAPTGDTQGSLAFWYPVAQSEDVRELFESGEPLIYRSGDVIDDLEPVGVFVYGDIDSEAISNLGLRRWVFSYVLIDDPYLDMRLGAFSWYYIDSLQVASSGEILRDGVAMEELLAGLTWNQIDALDWSVYA